MTDTALPDNKSPRHANVEQLLHLAHQKSSLHAAAKYRGSPVSSFMSLWGVSGIFVLRHLVVAISSWFAKCSMFSNKHDCFIKAKQEQFSHISLTDSIVDV